VRVIVSLLSMQAWFRHSIITIGEVTAISFLAPLFGTLRSSCWETGRLRRWSALGGASSAP
jgi:hypothetical protein